jgi:hypothetical protein
MAPAGETTRWVRTFWFGTVWYESFGDGSWTCSVRTSDGFDRLMIASFIAYVGLFIMAVGLLMARKDR